MTKYYVKLNFPSDLADLGVKGMEPESLPDPHPCVPVKHDQITFPKSLTWEDTTPAVFVVVDRLFIVLPDGVLRCDLSLALLTDVRIDRW